MALTTERNTSMFGKTNKEAPVKAVLNGTDAGNGYPQTIATGKTAAEAKANAMAQLLDAYKCNAEYPEVRFAADGSVFVGRMTASDRVGYTRYERNADGSTRTCGGSSGGPYIWDNETIGCRTVSLRRYMDYVAEQYNKAIAE